MMTGESQAAVFILLSDPIDHCFSHWDHCLQTLSVHRVFCKTPQEPEWNRPNPEVSDPTDSHIYHRFPHQLRHHHDSQHHL